MLVEILNKFCTERTVLRECFRWDGVSFGEPAQPIEEASALVVRQTLSGLRTLTGISTSRSS